MCLVKHEKKNMFYTPLPLDNVPLMFSKRWREMYIWMQHTESDGMMGKGAYSNGVFYTSLPLATPLWECHSLFYGYSSGTITLGSSLSFGVIDLLAKRCLPKRQCGVCVVVQISSSSKR